MREESEPIWFARWEGELPSPEELMPLSQSLITPDLALAFDISTANPSSAPPPPLPLPDFDSPERSAPPESISSGGGGGDEPARTLKRPRLVWTPQLHKRFVDAVAHLGIKNAVPKTIMQHMSVEGLTRENVASHLQKYRLYLKRMQGLSSSSAGAPMSAADAATEQLFASNPIPHPFFSRSLSRPGQQAYMQLLAPPLLRHHQQMVAAAAAQQQQFYHQRHLGHFGSPTDHGFHAKGATKPLGLNTMGVSSIGTMQPPVVASLQNSYGDDMDSGSGGGERRVLTLFPARTDD